MLFSLCGMDTSIRREGGGEKNLLPSTAVVATLSYELYNIYIYRHHYVLYETANSGCR